MNVSIIEELHREFSEVQDRMFEKSIAGRSPIERDVIRLARRRLQSIANVEVTAAENEILFGNGSVERHRGVISGSKSRRGR